MGGGGSEKWLNSFMGSKKSQNTTYRKVVGKASRKWKLWRSFSSGFELPAKEITFNPQPMVKVSVHKNSRFAAAAIRIQSMFRAFLARRALRALKSVVRIQAIFRGRRVRNEAAIALKRMQALVRIQGQVMAAMTKREKEEEEEVNIISRNEMNEQKTKEKQWCDSIGTDTVEEVKKQDEMKKEAIIRRERATKYYSSLSKPRKSTSSSLQEQDQEDAGWYESSVKVRKNIVSTRISAKPMMTTKKTRQPSCSFSESNVEAFYDDGMTTSSSSSSVVSGRHGGRNQLDLGRAASKPNHYSTRSNKMVSKVTE